MSLLLISSSFFFFFLELFSIILDSNLSIECSINRLHSILFFSYYSNRSVVLAHLTSCLCLPLNFFYSAVIQREWKQKFDSRKTVSTFFTIFYGFLSLGFGPYYSGFIAYQIFFRLLFMLHILNYLVVSISS